MPWHGILLGVTALLVAGLAVAPHPVFGALVLSVADVAVIELRMDSAPPALVTVLLVTAWVLAWVLLTDFAVFLILFIGEISGYTGDLLAVLLVATGIAAI